MRLTFLRRLHPLFWGVRAYLSTLGMRFVLRCRRGLFGCARFITPSVLTLYDAALGQLRTQSLAALVSLNISEILVLEGPKTAAALARETRADLSRLMRLLLFAASEGWISKRGDSFSANRVTRKLSRHNETSLAHFVQYFASEATALAFVQLTHVVRSGADAYPAAHGVGVWQYFAEHPTEGSTFDEAMINLTRLDADAIAAAYPFSRHRTLYDIGGGRGQQLRAILRRHPRVTGCVVDLPSVVARHAQARDEASYSYLSGDFFMALPAGADALLLRNILHDWDDERGLSILRRARESVAEGASLLIVEMLVGPDRAYPVGTLSDMTMLCATEGGRQRSEADFKKLFLQSGFRFVRTWPSGTPMVLVEARAVA